MKKQHFTIGLAGHIDHGKTELVKALTHVDTDRLKEEKERKISIELGYAPLINEENLNVSIIDVPGHEKFIRQMISGVSSIDLSLLVIAANEGIMPQTLEHMEVLNHLGLHNVIIVLTKIDLVDNELLELVREDLNETFEGTFLEGTIYFEVDSVSKKGIPQLQEAILKHLEDLNSRPVRGHTFLPVDQSFHLHGIGTIIRGTITQGHLSVGDKIYILPNGAATQVRGLHHFNQPVNEIFAGQRAAVALNNINLNEVNRGTVLTNDSNAKATSRLDIELNTSFLFKSSIKQRAPIKLHTGTSEVYGKIIFFDRNRLEQEEDVIYAQLVLEQPVYVLKDQRFILRRATPVELIGGGRVIDPFADKHSHNQTTIDLLKHKASFTEADYILNMIEQQPGVTLSQVSEVSESLIENLISQSQIIKLDQHLYSASYVSKIKENISDLLKEFHTEHPLLIGMNKSELSSQVTNSSKEGKIILDYLIGTGFIEQTHYFIKQKGFNVSLTTEQNRLLNQIIKNLSSDGLKVKNIHHYFEHQMITEDWIEFLIQQQYIVQLTEVLYVEKEAFNKGLTLLKRNTTEAFEVKDAKEILGLSRKYIIPFLEKLDKEKYTIRLDQKRKWL